MSTNIEQHHVDALRKYYKGEGINSAEIDGLLGAGLVDVVKVGGPAYLRVTDSGNRLLDEIRAGRR